MLKGASSCTPPSLAIDIFDHLLTTVYLIIRKADSRTARPNEQRLPFAWFDLVVGYVDIAQIRIEIYLCLTIAGKTIRVYDHAVAAMSFRLAELDAVSTILIDLVNSHLYPLGAQVNTCIP